MWLLLFALWTPCSTLRGPWGEGGWRMATEGMGNVSVCKYAVSITVPPVVLSG